MGQSLPVPSSPEGETLTLTLPGTGLRKIGFEATCGLATKGDWGGKTVVAGGGCLSSSYGIPF